jgi:DNA-binding winged helix-turn-helix (wHTH) protein/Tol biopolymer transport system component
VGATEFSRQPGRIFRFGPFEVSEADGELRKNGIRVKLQEQPFRVLVALVASAGRVVSREELQQQLWPSDTFVDFDTGLNTAIRKLRQAMNDDADEPRYIETLARRGYRFIAPATLVSAATEAAAEPVSVAGAAYASSSNFPQPPEPTKAPELGGFAIAVECHGALQTKEEPGSHKRWKWVAIGAVAAGLMAAFLSWWTRPPAAPVVEAITQLTDDEKAKSNLQTDGARIYFNEGARGGMEIAQVAVKGGPVAAIPTSVSIPTIGGIAPDGSSLLILQGPLPVLRPLWEVPLPAGEPRKVANLDAHEASFTPDGRLLLSRITDLVIAEKDASNQSKIISLTEGHFGDAAMSPDGRRIVFTHYPETELHIANSDGSGVELLAKNSERGGFCCARWTPDGKYIIFATRFPDPQQDLWYMRMDGSWLRSAGSPRRLTAGPLSYWSPAPSRDGKTIFATGTKPRGELVRYDLRSHTFVPFLPGISGSNLTFSADGQWLAYVSYPDRCLWRSRSDGSERLQLTVPPETVNAPFISPDGKWVVYGGRDDGTFILSMYGGTPQKLAKVAGGEANWSPDGRSLVFNEATNAWQTPEVKLADVQTGKISLVPGGQMRPLWAAPGKLIAARRDLKSLQLYDLSTQQWSDFTKPEDGPIGNWAHSPDFQYFYYTTRGPDPRIIRVCMADLKSEVVASLKDVHLAPGILEYTQLSVAPDGSPILLYAVGIQEIYALTVRWP